MAQATAERMRVIDASDAVRSQANDAEIIGASRDAQFQIDDQLRLGV